MSELTKCNHCDLIMIREDAKKKGMKVILIPASWGMGGIDVYVVPEYIMKKEILTWKDDLINRKRYWKCWFKELSQHCLC